MMQNNRLQTIAAQSAAQPDPRRSAKEIMKYRLPTIGLVVGAIIFLSGLGLRYYTTLNFGNAIVESITADINNRNRPSADSNTDQIEPDRPTFILSFILQIAGGSLCLLCLGIKRKMRAEQSAPDYRRQSAAQPDP